MLTKKEFQDLMRLSGRGSQTDGQDGNAANEGGIRTNKAKDA